MFNINDVGSKIAKITGGKYNDTPVFLTGDLETKKSFDELKLPVGKFQQIPLKKNIKDRQIWYVTGKSGSGKSVYVCNLCQEWKKINKGKDIYVFSAKKSDPNLDKIKPKRILIDESLINEPLSYIDFADSMVVFDDTDAISDKHLRKAVINIMNEILELGRDQHIDTILTFHQPTGGKETKKLLGETHYIVYFPHSGMKYQLNRLLIEYIGLDKAQIKDIKKTKSRWCCIHNEYPMYYITENKIASLDIDSESDSE